MLKRLSLIALALFALTFGEARAEMPQTDVALLEQMGDRPVNEKLDALAVYYSLHVSELIVQNMNERRTGSMFAVQRAKAAGKSAQDIAALERASKDVGTERAAKIQENQDLRVKLGELTGIDFSEPLIMAPDTPMDLQLASSDVPAALVDARTAAWEALQKAREAWQEERLILLDAQQRYDETRDVPIGDHLRAMTRAEIALAKAVGACRLIEARIAAASGKPIADALAAL